MVVQPITAPGNAPENPGINPYRWRIAPSGPNTAERRDWWGGKSVPVCLYHKTNLSTWQVGSLLTLKFFTWCMSKSPRSDCFWVRPPVAHIEVICDWVPPSWRFRIANSCWGTAFHRQGVSFKHLRKTAEFWGSPTNYRTFKKYVKKKITFFCFFC